MRIAITTCLLALLAMPASAQETQALERTREGRIDLQGVWVMEFITRLERPKEATALEVSPADARMIADAIVARSQSQAVTDPDFDFYGYDQLATVNGVHRTSLIVAPADGKIPYTTAGEALAERFNALESYGFANPEERPPYERCMSGILAAPIRTLPMLMPLQIVQTPDAVVLRNEDAQGFRIIPMGKPTSPGVPQFEGRSFGRWEGDTLVIETTDFRVDDIARPDMGPPIVLRPETRIIERFTRTGPQSLMYGYTVDDPVLYKSPWRVEFEMRLAEHHAVYEYACHEANYAMTNMLLAGLMGRQPTGEGQ